MEGWEKDKDTKVTDLHQAHYSKWQQGMLGYLKKTWGKRAESLMVGWNILPRLKIPLYTPFWELPALWAYLPSLPCAREKAPAVRAPACPSIFLPGRGEQQKRQQIKEELGWRKWEEGQVQSSLNSAPCGRNGCMKDKRLRHHGMLAGSVPHLTQILIMCALDLKPQLADS